MVRVSSIILLLILLCGCSSEEIEDVPEEIKKLNNLQVYPADPEMPHEISLTQIQTFGDTEEILIDRFTGVAVDDNGRVYIADNGQNKCIHVFDRDGDYVTQLGQEGGGPGEFRAVGNDINIKSGKLYINDSFVKRINIFSLDSLSFSTAIKIPSQDLPDEATYCNFFVTNDDDLLMGYQSSPIPNKERYNWYYFANSGGELISDQIIEHQATKIYGDESNGNSVTMILPFRRKSLMALSNNDKIYTAWTDDFLIKKFDEHGGYLEAYYYPYENSTLDPKQYISQFSNSNFRRAAQNIEYPDTWPALNEMQIDDKNRIWISTIGDDQDVYTWWVLDDRGQPLAQMDWPKESSIEVIKDGSLYAIEVDDDTGIEKVVQYDIMIEK